MENIIPIELLTPHVLRDINAVPKDSLPILEIFPTFEGEGSNIGTPQIFIRVSGCAVGCKWCFPSTHSIQTTEGIKRLHEVEIGDRLFTFDEDFNLTTTTVTKTLSRTVDPDTLVNVMYREKINGRIVTRNRICTEDHEWHVKNKGYVPAKDLLPGDTVYHINKDALNAFRMSTNNPMYNTETANKAHLTLKEGYASGRITSYERSHELNAFHSKRMKERNPMFKAESVKKMLLNKEYKKSLFEKVLGYILIHRLGYSDIIYTGSGDNKFLIGDDEIGYLVPDFMFTGTNKVLEVYNTTYPMYEPRRDTKALRQAYEKSRVDHYAQFGYDVEFITEFDLPESLYINNRLTKDEVISLTDVQLRPLRTKVNAFLRNGIKIVAVEKLTVKQKAALQRDYDNRATANDPVSVTNFTCEPHNHFLIDGVHVHNCDTKHSWNANGTKQNPAKIMKLTEIYEEVERISKVYGIRELHLTGGDPLHYPEQCIAFAEHFAIGHRTVLETSGVMFNDVVFSYFDVVSMDIKGPSSGLKNLAELSSTLKTHMYELQNGYFKFVAASRDDLDWLAENFHDFLTHGTGRFIRKPIVITPCADNTKDDVPASELNAVQNTVMEWLRDNAAKNTVPYSVRFIPQVHKLLNFR